ncbi:MAG TPA: hypothetical protein VJ985_01605 [Gammaproteobacteria bacterium]|nr:hypothetical protein [Gammaproteobacteria bacterium]
MGAIGVSRTISLQTPPPTLARLRALRSLQGYLGGGELSPAIREAVDGLGKAGGRVTVGGRPVYFAPTFEQEGYVYGWALLGESAPAAQWRRPCPQKAAVAPRECRPAWLCAPVQDGHVGVLGVSYRAATLPRQFELAAQNALKILEYTYGVQVEGQERFLKTTSGVGGIRLRSTDFELSDREGVGGDIRLYPKELRFHGDVLYVWLVSPDLPPYPVPEDLGWAKSAAGAAETGAVGVSRQTADSLLSSQLERAFEKGVFALAKNQGARIKSVEHVRQGTGGRYFLQGVSTKVDTTIQARMRGFYLHPDGRVSVWVVPRTGAVPESASTRRGDSK